MIVLGVLLGFYSYLFPGNINLMILDLYATRRYNILVQVGLIVILFECLYCYFTLQFIGQISTNQQLYQYIEWFAYVLTLVVGLWMVFDKTTKNKTPKGTIYRGLFSTIIHPQQIPFWIVMNVLFHNVIYFEMNSRDLLVFVFFNAVGASLVLWCYAIYGNKLLDLLKLKIGTISKSIGAFYIVYSFISLISS